MRHPQLPAAAALTGYEPMIVAQLSATITLTAPTISAQASDNSFNDSASGFVAAGFTANKLVHVSGFTGSGANNIYAGLVTAVTAGKLTVAGTDGDVIVDDAAGESVTITQWDTVRTTAQGVANLGGGNLTTVNLQTGTTYTYVAGDKGKLVSHSNASAIAGTLPQATGSFGAGWAMWVENRGAGTLTITPTTSTIDGAASLAMTANQGCLIVSDGTNYYTMRGVGGAGGSTQGKHAIPIMASAMSPSMIAGCASLQLANTSSGHPDIVSLDFDPTTEQYAMFALIMQKSWNEGTLTAKFKWSHPNAVTNFGVVWGIQAVAISDGDLVDAGYGTAQTVSDTGGTTNTEYVSAETSAITVGGSPAVEDTLYFRVYRKAADAADTLAVSARLHGIILYHTTDADTDA